MRKTVFLSVLIVSLLLVFVSCQRDKIKTDNILEHDKIYLNSPEINEDGSVTFRFFAPKAEAVSLLPEGNSHHFNKQEYPMTQNGYGDWHVTISDLTPGLHYYKYLVDGVKLMDQFNPLIQKFPRGGASYVEIPEPEKVLWDIRDVPHGTIETHYIHSSLLQNVRKVVVYKPNGIETMKKPIPVLYLLHGSGLNEKAWVDQGYVNNILDNMIAENTMNPMLVVMPYGYANSPENPRLVSIDERDKYELWFTNELIPSIDSIYQVQKNTKKGIAGFSMGGRQALRIGMQYPEKFNNIGGFSPAFYDENIESFIIETLKNKRDEKYDNMNVFLCCGKEDQFYEASQEIHHLFSQYQISNKFKTIDGKHTWRVWRKSLVEFLVNLN